MGVRVHGRAAPNTAPTVDKVRWKGVQLGLPGLLPGVRYRQCAFVPSVEVKMSYMSVR